MTDEDETEKNAELLDEGDRKVVVVVAVTYYNN
jgi:hypothetical protein